MRVWGGCCLGRRPRSAPRAKALLAALLAAFIAVSAVAPGTAWHAAQAASPASQGENLAHELDAIRQLIRDSLQALRSGDRSTAFQLAREAYLSHFELVEIPLRVLDAEFTLTMEYKFAEWRNRIRAGAPVPEIERLARELERDLQEVEALLQGPGRFAPGLAGLASFSILFREGLEAILVVAAILAYLRGHHPAAQRSVWAGAALALPASVLTWWLLDRLLAAMAPLGREVLEAAVSLVAAAVMFYVGFWLLQRLEVRRWMEFMQARVWAALSSGSYRTLAALAFVAVYREGAETVLFYQALLRMADRLERWVVLGAVLAAVALLAIGWAVLRLGQRLPLQTFLGGAMAMLMVISVGLVGNAVRALQEAGVLPATLLPGVLPRLNRFVADLLGLYPTRETLLAQAALVAVYVVGALYTLGGWPRRLRAA